MIVYHIGILHVADVACNVSRHLYSEASLKRQSCMSAITGLSNSSMMSALLFRRGAIPEDDRWDGRA